MWQAPHKEEERSLQPGSARGRPSQEDYQGPKRPADARRFGFDGTLDGLRDVRARARVRVERLAAGNPGDVRPVGEGVSELRIDYGPGYRVYFKRQGRTVVVLLAGGDKRSQRDDVETALRLARNL